MGRITVFGNPNDSIPLTAAPHSIFYGDPGGVWNGIIPSTFVEEVMDAYFVIKTNTDSVLGNLTGNFEYNNNAPNNAVYVTVEGSEDPSFNLDANVAIPMAMTLYTNSSLTTVPHGNSTVANSRLVDSVWHIPNFVVPTKWWRVGFGTSNTIDTIVGAAVSIDLVWTER